MVSEALVRHTRCACHFLCQALLTALALRLSGEVGYIATVRGQSPPTLQFYAGQRGRFMHCVLRACTVDDPIFTSRVYASDERPLHQVKVSTSKLSEYGGKVLTENIWDSLFAKTVRFFVSQWDERPHP